jgi:hypothetical protein
MSRMLQGFIEGLKIGEGQSHDSLTIFPIFSEPHAGPDYLLLTDALKENLIEVTEISQAGSVPNLKVANHSDRMVLIVDGEELVGAKQNRVVNTTILVGAESELTIPVTCVEQGRWTYRSPLFSAGSSIGPVFLRAEKAKQVHDSLKFRRGYASDQTSIWRSISDRFIRSSSSSPTWAMSDLYTSTRRRLGEFVRNFRCHDGQCGVVVAIGPRIAGMDVFGNALTYRQFHKRLIESYAMDAIDPEDPSNGKPPARKKAERFQRNIAGSRFEERPGVGLGTDTRIAGERISGFALSLGDCLLHLAAFRLPEADSELPGPKLASILQRMRGRIF